jgi:tetratricopeptide (TPR) repeat protein
VIRASQIRPLWTAVFGVPLLFLAIVALQVRIDAQTRSEAQESRELVFRSGPLMEKLSLGYESILADIYWTRAVQYYGARIGTPNVDYPLLWPFLDLATTLDPKLVVAYRFGAVFLSEPRPVGAGQTDRAIELIRRGIAANPDEWRLSTDLGFLYYWRLKDYPNAAAAYLQASQNPKALSWVKVMAARISERGGSIETSHAIWSEIYDSSKDTSVRNMAMEQLRGIKAQEDELNLDALAEQYRKRFGRYPATSKELRDAGFLVGIPVDPTGFPYIFGPDGKSKLNPQSSIPAETPLPSAPSN